MLNANEETTGSDRLEHVGERIEVSSSDVGVSEQRLEGDEGIRQETMQERSVLGMVYKEPKFGNAPNDLGPGEANVVGEE